MTVETFTYVTSLTAANPGASDPKSEGDDHLRGIKTVLLNSFPNVAGAVSATHTQLSYVTGVTSAIQTQLDAKAPLASPTLTGTPLAPTAIAGTNTTQIATTAFVGAAVIASSVSGLTLISTATASSSATIDFTGINSTYEEYELHYINVVPATDNASLYFRSSSDGGSSYDAGTSYDVYSNAVASSGVAQFAVTTGVSFTATRGGASGIIKIYDPSDTTHNKYFVQTANMYVLQSTTNGGLNSLPANGSRTSTSAVNAVRLLFSSGNIASGKFKLYGVKK